MRFGVSPLVIGLTVVAFGTSAPELAVSVQSGLAGQSGIAVGNIVGSCLFNLPVIAGIAALVTPGGLGVAASLTDFDIPVMVAVALACLPIFATGVALSTLDLRLFSSPARDKSRLSADTVTARQADGL